MYNTPISNLDFTLSSLETALAFTIQEEERLWRMADEVYNAGSDAEKQAAYRERYEAICAAWRPQVKACETIAHLIQSLNPEYKDERFNTSLNSKQITSLKRYPERKAEKTLSFPYNK